jgi:hypothetical protein
MLADPLYRWQDAQGNLHYSDHHPPAEAKILHPDIGHEPTPEELEAAKRKKLAKEAEAAKKEVQQKEETPNRPVVIIPVPIIQNPPEVYMPYWGPIYPYRRQLVYPRSRPYHVHPRNHRARPPVDRPTESTRKPIVPSKTR